MRLIISEIGKINKADITVDGITVITGENNSAKSTVGKTLFSLFNSMRDIRNKVVEVRADRIIKQVGNELESELNKKGDRAISRFSLIRMLNAAIGDDIRMILDEQSDERIKYIVSNDLKNHLSEIGILMDDDGENRICSIIDEVKGVTDDSLMKELTKNYFDGVFAGQIHNVYSEEQPADAEIIIKEQSVRVQFDTNNICTSIERGLDIEHEAFYIDDPFVVDWISYIPIRWAPEGCSYMQRHLINKMNVWRGEEDVIETVTAKEKLQEVYGLLEKTIDGQIVRNNDNLSLRERDGGGKAVRIANISTGTKSFVLIKLLLERGIIKKKDVVILDEPEIHLHAEWQRVYAEIIVLLQKYFDLTVLLTTHSSQFARAIETFAILHGVKERCNFYQAENEEGVVCFQDVTECVEKMYYTMVAPEIELEALFNQVTNDDEE